MGRVRVIPALLLKNKGLVKTIKFADPKYVGDPINAIKIFNDKGVDELVFLDITASVENKEPNFKLLAEIATECFMPLGYGGGVKNLAQIEQILSMGFEKVIINSEAGVNPNFIKQASDKYGSSTIVVSIDYKKNLFGKAEVFVKSGSKNLKVDPVNYAKEAERSGAGEILLTSIDREGSMKGYDLDLIKKVSGSVGIPVIASGGAGTVQDLISAVEEGHASAVSAGSMFVFHGKHRAVLINFPSEEDLADLYNE